MSLYKKLIGMFAGLVCLIFIYINFFVIGQFERNMIEKVPESSVLSVYSIVEAIGKKVESKTLSEEEAKKEILYLIQQTRLKDGTYFWIHDLNNKMVLHPVNEKLNGTDISSIKDPNGHFIFTDMNQIVLKNNGEGVYNYLWPKPGKKDPIEKTSFVKLYKPWGWVIGSGMYVEDVRASMSSFFNQIKIILTLIFIIAIIAAHFIIRKLITSINNTVETLSATVHELQNSSTKMSLVSRSLAHSVDSQVSSITQSVTAMDEISAMIKQNEHAAAQSISLSNQTKTSAISGKNTVNKMLHEMQDISNSYDQIHSTVIENGKEISDITNVINQIVDKTKVINEIVFQTKLLSFNAAVEAARAGDAGKGFAVVAEEVGNLANMSGNAANEINNMLEESQKKVKIIAEQSTRKVTTIVDSGRSKVVNGNQVAEECLKELDLILGCVNEQDHSINQISVAIREQSIGVDEVNDALRNLNDNTTQSVKMSGNTKEASESLKVHSYNLRVAIQDLRKMLGSKKNYDVPPME